MNENIKYIGLQMLTGGMYFGAEAAIGHPAECMISYPGFDSVSMNEGKIIRAGNEYHLIKYLEKKNRMVPYYQFDRKPFQSDMDMNPKILKDGKEIENPDYSDIDIVVAVPVCSGLSTATYGCSAEVKASRNCNMLWLANYAMKVIKPKIYVFENAPTLMGASGAFVRAELEKAANEAGYSVAYYKTDTMWHDNCQRRPRAFVYFFREDESHKGVPTLGFEHKNISAKELLSRIPSDATQQEPLPICDTARTLLDFAHYKYGNEWRKHLVSVAILDDMVKQHQLDEWRNFVNNTDYPERIKNKVNNYITHIYEKLGEGKGFWRVSPTVVKHDGMPTAMHKNIKTTMHYDTDRTYSVREWLTSMGMPFDFEMQGDNVNNYFKQIGQNVPARTAQFIVSEAVRIINNWDTVERDKVKVKVFDNTKV